MHLEQLDLNLLVALDALLRERSVTAAGRRVFVTQSTMSGALGRLRLFFGDQLLMQVGRRMVPTPLGQSLAGPVREILTQIKSTIAIRPGFDPGTSLRRFSLATPDDVAAVLMPGVLRHAAVVAPGIGFDVLSIEAADPLDQLDWADADCQLVTDQYYFKEHAREHLYADKYTCLVCAHNAEIGDCMTMEQYAELGHVVLRHRGDHNAPIDDWLLVKVGVERRPEVVVGRSTAIPQLILGTQRIATVPRRLAEFYARYLPLRIVPLPVGLPLINVALQWHPRTDTDPAIRWLRNLLVIVAKETDAERGTADRTEPVKVARLWKQTARQVNGDVRIGPEAV